MLLSLSHTTTTTIHTAMRAAARPAAQTSIGARQPDPVISTDQPPAEIRAPATDSASPSPSTTHTTSLTPPPSPGPLELAGRARSRRSSHPRLPDFKTAPSRPRRFFFHHKVVKSL